MHGKDPQLILAGQTMVLDGSVALNGLTTERSAILECPSLSSLPGGLLVKTCLIDLPTKAPFKVPVVLTNETDHDVIIPRKCVVGEVSVF